MPSIEELTVAAVRSAMAPGYEREQVGVELLRKAAQNTTALRIARARVERGAGWRAGPIGQRARDALTHAIELAERGHEIDLTETTATSSPGGSSGGSPAGDNQIGA
ncbi:MAG: hypothetical protein ACLFWR_12550 [Acidimicrobiales bacterium]